MIIASGQLRGHQNNWSPVVEQIADPNLPTFLGSLLFQLFSWPIFAVMRFGHRELGEKQGLIACFRWQKYCWPTQQRPAGISHLLTGREDAWFRAAQVGRLIRLGNESRYILWTCILLLRKLCDCCFEVYMADKTSRGKLSANSEWPHWKFWKVYLCGSMRVKEVPFTSHREWGSQYMCHEVLYEEALSNILSLQLANVWEFTDSH